MPLKTYRGPSIGPLLTRAQLEIGADAVVVRTTEVAGEIELIAADAETAEALGRLIAPASPATVVLPKVPASVLSAPVAAPRPIRSVIAVVGPTGAGKTTTVAKLAAHAKVFEGQRVGLICLDTYRVGAVEQLRTHAQVAERRLEVIHQSRDVARALRRLADCGVILVDCPGRGPRAQRDTDAVRAILSELRPDETHLALPAGLRTTVARRLIEQQVPRGLTHLLVTKLDEVPDDWSLFDLAAEVRLPMRWVTDGQRVPQDVRSAAPRLEAAQASHRSRRARRGAAA